MCRDLRKFLFKITRKQDQRRGSVITKNRLLHVGNVRLYRQCSHNITSTTGFIELLPLHKQPVEEA